MDARGPGATQVLRKTVVVKMAELSVSGFRELVSNGMGGLLLLLPPGLGIQLSLIVFGSHPTPYQCSAGSLKYFTRSS